MTITLEPATNVIAMTDWLRAEPPADQPAETIAEVFTRDESGYRLCVLRLRLPGTGKQIVALGDRDHQTIVLTLNGATALGAALLKVSR